MVRDEQRSSAVQRLVLCDRSPTQGGVDGAWWPATAELGSALPDLVAVVGRYIGPVSRVVYDPAAWGHAPSRVIRGDVVVRVEPYSLRAADTIYLLGTHSRDALFYVIAPETKAAAAQRILATVSDPTQPSNVAVLRHLKRRFTAADDADFGHAAAMP
jgi:hypothetical protein